MIALHHSAQACCEKWPCAAGKKGHLTKIQLLCRVVVASTGKRSTQDLTGVDGDVIALEGNGWVVVRTSDGSETLRVQQRYLEKRPKEHSEVAIRTLNPVCV